MTTQPCVRATLVPALDDNMRSYRWRIHDSAGQPRGDYADTQAGFNAAKEAAANLPDFRDGDLVRIEPVSGDPYLLRIHKPEGVHMARRADAAIIEFPNGIDAETLGAARAYFAGFVPTQEAP